MSDVSSVRRAVMERLSEVVASGGEFIKVMGNSPDDFLVRTDDGDWFKVSVQASGVPLPYRRVEPVPNEENSNA